VNTRAYDWIVLFALTAALGCSASPADVGNAANGSAGGGAGTAAGSTSSGSGGISSAGGAGVPITSGAGGSSVSDASASDVSVPGADAGVPTGVGCPSPGTLCWDFETGAIPTLWTASRNEFNGQILVDNTRPHRGTYSLHAKDLIGGTEGTAGGPKKSLRYLLPANFGPTMWGRAFVYTTPARPASHAGLFNARYPRPNSTATDMSTLDWYEVASYQQKYMSVWHPPEPPGFPEWVLLSDTPLVLDAWTCLEWLFDGSGGGNVEAAEPRVWLDGTELTWPTKFTFSDPDGSPRPTREKAQNFTMIETGVVMYQGLTKTTNWWIDDLAVGPQRIGCN